MARNDTDDQDAEVDSATPTRLELLASLVRQRREGLWNPEARKYGVTMDNAAATADMSPVTWRRVESGKSVRGLSYTGVEAVLDWPGGSIRRYLEGGPEPTGPDTPAPTTTPLAPPTAAPLAPTLLDATHDELLAELRRRLRHLEPSAPITEQRPHLAASSEGEESVEAVEAQGGRAGLPRRGSEGGGDDVAEGGQA